MHIRILLASFLEEFGCGIRKTSHREGLGNDVRGLLRSSQGLLDLGFKQSFFLLPLYSPRRDTRNRGRKRDNNWANDDCKDKLGFIKAMLWPG